MVSEYRPLATIPPEDSQAPQHKPPDHLAIPLLDLLGSRMTQSPHHQSVAEPTS